MFTNEYRNVFDFKIIEASSERTKKKKKWMARVRYQSNNFAANKYSRKVRLFSNSRDMSFEALTASLAVEQACNVAGDRGGRKTATLRLGTDSHPKILAELEIRLV